MRTETDSIARRLTIQQPLIRDYPAVLLRGKWIVLAVSFLCLVVAFVFTKLKKPTYQASAAVLVQTRIAESGGLFIPAVGSAIVTNIRQNELEILRSQSLAESVARRLINKMYVDSSARQMLEIIMPGRDDKGKRTVATVDQIVKRLSTAVDFVTVRESDVIKIIAKSADPVEAAFLANTFTEEYYKRNVYKSREKSRTLREFLQAQVSEQRSSLERLEGALQAYMENKGIVSLDEESRRMIEQLSGLEANRDATDISIQTLERTLASYKYELPQQEQVLANSIISAADPYIRSLQEQLAALEVQRDVAISKNPTLAGKEVFSDKLREVDQQIQSLQEKLRTRTKGYIETLVPSPVNSQDQATMSPSAYVRQVKQKILEAQVELQALTAKKEALNRVIAEYERQFEKIPGRNIQYARLERGRQSSEKLFIVLNDKLNEANISEQSQFGHIEIIDQASVPSDPSSPNTMLNLAIGGAVGLFIGIVMVIGREFRDIRIHTPEDLKLKGHFPAAVITSMHDEIRRLDGNRVMSRYGRPVDPHLLTLADSFSPVAEAYRKLRTTIQFDRSDKRPQTILVSSANSGEGKSTTAANLAIAYAQSGLMTLLIDCNLRRPRLHGMFDVHQSPGIAELVTGRVGYDAVVQMTAQKHLHFLGSGSLPSHPAELLSSDRMKDLFEQAKLEYDIIIIDSAPLLSVADASILSTLVDCTLIVVAAGKTRMEELERGVEIVGAVSSAFPKFVLNMFDQQRAYGISYKRSGYGFYGDARRNSHSQTNASAEQQS